MSATGEVSEIERVVRRFYDEVWNARRYEVAEELIHPDFAYPGAPGVTGHEAKVAALRGYHAAMPDLRVKIEDLVIGAGSAAVRFSVDGTDTGGVRGRAPSGRSVHVWGVDVFGFEDGRIASNWVGVDWLGLLVQTDAIPDPWR